MTKLLIVDQSLRDLNGHHYEYDISVAKAALAKGLAPTIAAHLDFDRSLAKGIFGVNPVFKHAWNEVNHGRLKNCAFCLLNSLPNNWANYLITGISSLKKCLPSDKNTQSVKQPEFVSFGAELYSLVINENLSPSDHILIHTLAISELHAAIAAFGREEQLPFLHFVLRRDAGEPAVREDPWGGVFEALKAVACNERLRKKITFYADTEELCAQYQALHELIKVYLLPIPHELMRPPDISGPDIACRPLRLTYLGNARTEKGFHHLPGLVKALKQSHLETGLVKFVIQANSSMSLEERIIHNVRKKLAAYPQDEVQILLAPLSRSEFQRHLFEADIVLLPYEPKLYQNRSSGIMVQAIAAGRPVVAPEGTWMAKAAPPGTCVTYKDVIDFPKACIKAVDEIETLRQAVCEAGKDWRSFHNAESFMDVLLADK